MLFADIRCKFLDGRSAEKSLYLHKQCLGVYTESKWDLNPLFQCWKRGRRCVSGHCNERIPTNSVLLDGFQTLEVVFKISLCAV